MAYVAVSGGEEAIEASIRLLEYYRSGKADGLIHPETRDLLEKLLCMLAEEGEEKTYSYIRHHVLKDKAQISGQ